MQRVRVKIEGLREAATAVEIARMGADAIGLVFAESPRQVSPAAAAEIVRALPPWVATVGVFVDCPVERVNELVKQTGIQYVQLHGDEPPTIVAQINARCIKAFPVRDEGWLVQVRDWLQGLPARDNFAGVLLDAFSPDARGGTGRRFNWELVAEARTAGMTQDIGPIILAGGLDADCVVRAIETVKPWAVDVASGVESAPGVKDLRKVRQFLQAVRQGGELGELTW